MNAIRTSTALFLRASLALGSVAIHLEAVRPSAFLSATMFALGSYGPIFLLAWLFVETCVGRAGLSKTAWLLLTSLSLAVITGVCTFLDFGKLVSD